MQLEKDMHVKPAQGDYDRELLGNVRPPAWRNPKPAGQYHLVIVGAGPAGLVAAHAAAALGAKVALIERNRLGGDCLNEGCVPSKTIIRTSRLYAEMCDAVNYGAQLPAGIEINFAAVMERMRRVRARISRVDSAERLRNAGVDVYFGDARFSAPDTVVVGNTTLRFRKAMIATGTRPDTPSIPGLGDAGFLTNDTVFNLTALPRRLLVIGGGPLGCELAQAFCRLGSQVFIVQNAPLFLPKEERDAVQLLSDAFARDGIEIHLNTRITGVRKGGFGKIAECISADYQSTLAVDEILVGIGRVPNVEGLGLDLARVEYDAINGIHVNDFLRTTNPRIYAAGDVCLDCRFTHTADASARIVVRNALFLGRQRWSALTIPWCTYTDPEIAHVGMYVREAREK
ncbi:MAG: FAD-dependent oxidoreductase, partial [Betaproteobacteria bacterium]